MSKITNVWLALFEIFLNHSITDAEFLHWFKTVCLRMLVFILSTIDLLKTPMSLFEGLMRRQEAYFQNCPYGLLG